MSTEYRKVIERQDTRINLNSIIRSQFLAFDTDANHLVYSKDGVNYYDFYNKTELDSKFVQYVPLSGAAVGTFSATSFVKVGGTSTQFLKANGTVDSNTYISGTGTSVSGQVPFFTGSAAVSGSSSYTWDGNTVGIGLDNNLGSPKVNIKNSSSIAGGPELNLIGAAGATTDANSCKLNFGAVGESGVYRFLKCIPYFKFQRYDAAGTWNTVWSLNSISATNLDVTFGGAIIKSGGTNTQFLKADGSTDSNTYALASSVAIPATYIPVGTGTGIAGNQYLTYATGVGSGRITVSGPSQVDSSVWAQLEGVGSSFRCPKVALSGPNGLWEVENYYGKLQFNFSAENAVATLSNTGSYISNALAVYGAAATSRDISLGTGNSLSNGAAPLRWIFRANATAESGGNAGSDFELWARTDGGAGIDSPLTINRAGSGQITLGGGTNRPLTITGATTFSNLASSTGNLIRTINSSGQIGFAAVVDNGSTIALNRATTLSSTLTYSTATSGTVAYFDSSKVMAGSSKYTWDGTTLGIGLDNSINNPKLTIWNNTGNAGGPEINLIGAAGAANDANSCKINFGSGSGSFRFIGTTQPNFKLQRYDGVSAWNTVYALASATLTNFDMSFYGNLTAPKFITSGGSSSQFVKGDGALDSNTYAVASTLANYLPLSGGIVTGPVSANSFSYSGTIRDYRGRDTTVIDVVNCQPSPPGSPTANQQWLITSVAQAAWSGHDGDIAHWTGSAWSFFTPSTYALVRDNSGAIGQTLGGSRQALCAAGLVSTDKIVTAPASVAAASIFIQDGTVDPTIPSTGDIWRNGSVIAVAGRIKPANGTSFTITGRTGTGSTATTDDFVRYTGTGGHTETLPTAIGSGRILRYKHFGTAGTSWSIARAGTDLIDIYTGVSLAKNDLLEIVDAASGMWNIVNIYRAASNA